MRSQAVPVSLSTLHTVYQDVHQELSQLTSDSSFPSARRIDGYYNVIPIPEERGVNIALI